MTMRLLRRVLAGALAAGAFVSVSIDSYAHGGIPRAYQILFEPGNVKHIVLRSDLWGFFDSRDGGDTWSYVCAEAWGGISSQLQNRTLALMPGGRFLMAAHFDGLRLSDDTCTWRQLPVFENENVPVVVVGPDSPETAYALTSTGNETGIKGQLWRSSDRGETWNAIGPKYAPEFAPTSLAFAPSNAKRVYIAGNIIENAGSRVLVSSDGGTSWQSFDMPIVRSDTYAPRIVVVDPNRPDVALVRIDGEEGFGENVSDELWATTDGAKTWSKIYEGPGDLPGTALDSTSGNLFIAGPLDGVKSAALDAALSMGQSAFQSVLGGMAYGLRITPDGLLIGGDNYGARGVPEYTLGASTDQARSVNILMTMCDLQLAACGPTTTVGERCGPIWSGDGETLGFKAEYIDARCTPDATGGGGMAGGAGLAGSAAMSATAGAGGTSVGGASSTGSAAGAHSGPVTHSTGCSCALGVKEREHGAGILSALPLMGALIRRRRSKSRVQAAQDCTPATLQADAAQPPLASARTEA